MFKKISDDQLKKRQNVSKGDVKKLKDMLTKCIPKIGLIFDTLVPKKANVSMCKLSRYDILYFVDNVPSFVQSNNIAFPMLKTVMKYPDLVPSVYTDDGAVKPLCGGSNLKAPGIKSMSEEPFDKDAIVQIRLMDKEIPYALGLSLHSSEELKNVSSGDAMKTLTILRDGLYMMT